MRDNLYDASPLCLLLPLLLPNHDMPHPIYVLLSTNLLYCLSVHACLLMSHAPLRVTSLPAA